MKNDIIELSSNDLQVIVNALQTYARQEERAYPSKAKQARQIANEINEKFQTWNLNGSIFQLRWNRTERRTTHDVS